MEKQEFLQLDFGLNFEKREKEKPVNPKKAKSDFVFDMMDCLTSPIIVHDSAWRDCIPKDVITNIPMARMIAVMAKEEMATIPEVVAYLMPRTFDAPMPYGWTNIYTWCGMQYVSRYKNKEQLEPMKGIAPEKLTSNEKRDLDHLRRWIYDRRRKALKQRMKSSEKPKSITESKQVKLL